MLEKLIKEIALYKSINESEITPESNLIIDLGVNSLELFEILFPFEELVEFSDDDIEVFSIETVGELGEFLQSRAK